MELLCTLTGTAYKKLKLSNSNRLSLLQLQFFCNRKILGKFCDAYLLMATLVLWIPSRKFVHSLTDDMSKFNFLGSLNRKKKNWAYFDSEFAILKELAWLVARTFGHMVVYFVLECLLRYGYNMERITRQIQQSTDWKV